MKIDKVTKMIEQPEVWLCHRNYDKICILSPIDDLKIYKTANAVDEISFTFHKINDGFEFEYWEQIKDLKVALVDGFGYFEIAVDKNVSDDTTKVITGVSTEAELAQISIYELEVNGENDRDNTDNFASNGEYIPTTLYDNLDHNHSLLHRLLSKAQHWSFGSIAETITDNGKEVSSSQIYRTFNFDNTNIYDALQEIAKEFDVVFTFNTVNRKINMYDLNKVGEDTTVYVSTENLANDFTCTSNKDSIKNCFKIVGGDDLINGAIRSINTNGSDYIYYFSPEQMEDMSDGLKTSLRAYDDLCEENKEEYEKVCSDLYDAIDEVNELETAMFPDRQPLSPTTASAEIQKLTASNLGDIPVEKIDSLYETGAKRAVETIAQLKVDYRYEVDIEDGYTYDSTAHTFTCKFKVTSANDSAVSSTDIVLNLVEDQKETLQQKINNMLGEVDIEDSDITTFKTNLNNYSQKYLEDYTSIYKECTKVLSERGYDNKDKVSTDLYNFYHDYWEKWKACEEALAIRKSQVATASENKKELEDKLKELQDKLNFEKCLGGYYEEFCKYRREDTYQNDNYISDGMNTSELFKNAKQLVETATKELIKASTFQTTYTANLNNLFTNPIYEPFYEHFELFNWIHADIDNKHIMLRLIGITFDFSAIDKIEVEFSEQVRNANGLTDLQSILGQAKSMATSYSSTVKQALNGSEVCLEFDTLKQEGLNSALMNIKNSNNEEVVIDNCGINCKSKDQNDQYDMHQLRITGKNIVMTDDDWETARLAIGLMNIDYDSDGDGITEEHEIYGVIADYLQGDLVISKDIRVLNKNSSVFINEDGLYIINRETNVYTKIDCGAENVMEIGTILNNEASGSIGTPIESLNTQTNAKKIEVNIITINNLYDFKVDLSYNFSYSYVELNGEKHYSDCETISSLSPETQYELIAYDSSDNMLSFITFTTPVEHEHDYVPVFENVDNIWYSKNHDDSSTAICIWNANYDTDVLLEFKYGVSSESNYDNFTIYVDDVSVATISGTDVSEYTYSNTLSAGVHSIKAEYSKDYSTSKGDDRGYIILPENFIVDDSCYTCSICGKEKN